MNKVYIFISIVIVVFISFVFGHYFNKFLPSSLTNPNEYIDSTPFPTPLSKYDIDNLATHQFNKGKLTIGKELDETENYNSYLFSFDFSPGLNDEIKTTSGQINLLNNDGKYPIVLMLRGYVDQEIYTTGMGTKSASDYFSDRGFITIAPDFLGYAQSDENEADIFESRFQTYTTVLSLLNSLDAIEKWDGQNIFMWGHSNGGHLAIAVLEITEKDIPTTLWAPVSKPFPYSVLYYTDESEDRGRLIRRELAKFEDIYNTDKYSITEYLNKINTTLQIHQGASDDSVPIDWSDELYNQLLGNNIEVTYYTYQGADHNLRPSWDEVVQRDVEFFRSQIK